MLRSLQEIRNYALLASDGEIGRCKDFLFDEAHWMIRYMVADTRKWLPGRKVLVSPNDLDPADWSARQLPVRLSREDIESAPHLDEDAPVSRRHEMAGIKHFGWPAYWVGESMPGPQSAGVSVQPDRPPAPDEADEPLPESTSLRSAQEVTGYGIEASDGEIGNVVDLIAEDDAWTIRWLVVDTGFWLPGRRVLVSPSWVESIDWSTDSVRVSLSRGSVEKSPEFDPSAPVNREYEERLYDFYGRPVHWREERA